MNNAWQAIKKHKAIDDNFDKSSDYESNPLCEVLKLEIPEHWDVVPLSQVTDYQEGPGILAKDFTENGIPLLRLRNIEGTTVKLEGCNFLDKNKVSQKWTHFALQEGDLLISTSASLGRVSIVGPEAVGAIAYTGIIRFRSKSEKLDQNFLRAFLSSSVFIQQAEQMATGSVIRHFGPTHLKQMAIILPSLQEQVLIANIFDSFDKRIGALRETNATLESIAQALFKSWFIDFDPVHAKAEGREPEGMDAETAALFPDSFEESELGMIPKGWRVGTLSDLATLNPESWSNKNHPDTVLYIDLANAKENIINEITEYSFESAPSRARRVLRDGDTIIGTVRPGNRSFALINNAPPNLTGSTGFAVLRPCVVENTEFLYLAMTSDANIDYLTHVADGGAYPAVRPEVVINLKTIIPSPELILAYHTVVKPLLICVSDNHQKIQYITDLRDVLLPRLISGQLHIDNEDLLGRL
ncbi:restriction endonuclease subunit S [Legionella pneumophila]|uniref:restriction endonuclease subunit S n=1 Tax=Legionella pneumophila TaxID=446 RepID=UPI00101F5C64|nr:restriction endonuclease subunit S [Legionella pneumophila]RYW92009.1 restriction endonuclease subunit S [Legionella pneumophila]HAT1775840.1 restriction endonuclease subunit S [Legionella pneumophila]HAT1778296.1 restriction endonuclease subunit S [Legionella pneumophila]HAT2018674.1 restriction endonuclease subunit S [Legionella pneumophila]HAT2024603.1 restriction endonuclease subunit S [Legionella pneumophila]